MAEETVSKKKQKSLQFRKSKDERAAEKAEKAQRKAEIAAQEAEKQAQKEQSDADKKQKKAQAKEKRKLEAAEAGDEPGPKKRKTRRGKKGKGVNNGSGPRFILFIGNLPYDTTQTELDQHFKNAQADRIRLRKEKGIAFLEFDNEGAKIQSKMDHALGMHHSMFRGRKINVELTVGGGGNSDSRSAKLKEKNDKLMEERREKTKKDAAKKAEKAAKADQDKPKTVGGMHPARAALMK